MLNALKSLFGGGSTPPQPPMVCPPRPAQDAAWWRGAVVYQIYPRSFMDSNGDGIGDLQGIIDKLDYLNDGTPNSLGVDALWLSPIFPSPMFDFGYDISDFEGIDPAFGDLATFRRLLEEAHKRGIKILLDLVVNHTSHLHPWFVESRSSRDNPKRDWYIWRNPVNGREPNNWMAFFGGKGWELDKTTGQYYFHSFLTEQPDLNWRNPEVEKAIFKMISFWLEMGVDGFRLDVVNLYFKDQQLRDNPVIFTRIGRAFDRQDHIYDRNQPEMHDYLRRFRALLDSHGQRTSVGEVTLQMSLMGACLEDSATPAAFQGNNDELHMTFNFAFLFANWSAETFRNVIVHWEEALKGDSWPCYTLSNHDYVRHISRFAAWSDADTEARARIAAMLLLTLRGTPFVYYGEEIGMREDRVPKKHLQDPLGKRYWPFFGGRDGCRRPMAWSDAPGSGFTAREAQPWLPDYTQKQKHNVEAESAKPDSLLVFYRKLIWHRKRSPALLNGGMEILMGTPKGILAYRRPYKEHQTLVVLNFNKNTTELPLSERDQGQITFCTSEGRAAKCTSGASI